MELTEENIKKVLKDIMFTGFPETGEKPMFREFKKDLDSLIQKGYLYMLKSDKLTLMTGTGGIKDFIEASREAGMPDWMIAQDIYITNDTSLMTNTQWHWIGDIYFTKLKDD